MFAGWCSWSRVFSMGKKNIKGAVKWKIALEDIKDRLSHLIRGGSYGTTLEGDKLPPLSGAADYPHAV